MNGLKRLKIFFHSRSSMSVSSDKDFELREKGYNGASINV